MLASQILEESKIKIYNGKQRILIFNGDDKYNINEFETNLILGRKPSLLKSNIKLIDSYEDLLRMGYQVSKRARHGNKAWHFLGQKVEYFLIKTSSGYPHMGEIPREHIVEFNFVDNWLRLVGSNTDGNKVYFKTQIRAREKYKDFEPNDYIKIYENYMQEISPFTIVESEEKIRIPEIGLIMTYDGKLVCLPQSKDNPTIGILGKKGMGKTMLLHGIADRVYWKWGKKIFIGNDISNYQTKSWCHPWDFQRDGYFIKQLEQIGETTIAMPCVYLTPSVKNLGYIDMENVLNFKIALSYKEIITNLSNFFRGTDDELRASRKYFNDLIYDNYGNLRPDGLYYAKSIEDIERIVNEKVVVEKKITINNVVDIEKEEVFRIDNEKVRAKFFSLLKENFQSQLFDVTAGCNSKWIVESNEEKYSLYPWDACLFADVVPVLLTKDLFNHPSYPSYQRFIMEDIYNRQKNDKIIERNKSEIWHFLDEIHTIIGERVALESFSKIARDARNVRQGIVYNTQHADSIPDVVYSATDYVIAFRQIESQAKKIAGSYDYLKHQQRDLVKLKRYECIIAGEEIVTYDTEGKMEKLDDGTPFKGIIFPSVSQHSAPKGKV